MEALTSEDIWRMFRETDKQIKETDKELKEVGLHIKETDRLIRELSRKWGNTSENIGFSAETHFQSALAAAMTLGGIKFDDLMPNVRRQRRDKSCEFDILLLNHKDVAVIEVKHRVPKSLPEKMAEDKAKEFRTFFPEYKDYALYLGVAGMSVEAGALEQAKKYGVGVLTQGGNALECADIPLRAY